MTEKDASTIALVSFLSQFENPASLTYEMQLEVTGITTTPRKAWLELVNRMGEIGARREIAAYRKAPPVTPDEFMFTTSDPTPLSTAKEEYGMKYLRREMVFPDSPKVSTAKSDMPMVASLKDAILLTDLSTWPDSTLRGIWKHVKESGQLNEQFKNTHSTPNGKCVTFWLGGICRATYLTTLRNEVSTRLKRYEELVEEFDEIDDDIVEAMAEPKAPQSAHIDASAFSSALKDLYGPEIVNAICRPIEFKTMPLDWSEFSSAPVIFPTKKEVSDAVDKVATRTQRWWAITDHAFAEAHKRQLAEFMKKKG